MNYHRPNNGKLRFSGIFFILILFHAFRIMAQHTPPDTILAIKCTDPIKLDGVLDESCWQQAPYVNNFRQRELHQGELPTEETRVAVLYTENKIYFGVWCFDSEPDKIVAQQMARDFNWGSDDNFEIIISPFNDNRNGYLFVTNPNGALADVYVANEGGQFNKSWDGVWDVAVTRNDSGWFIEFVIPFTTLKFSKDSVQVWGINFERNIRRKNEQLLWQGWYRVYEIEKISQGGHLAGLKGIKQGTKVELKPYVLGGTEIDENEKAELKGKIGGEVNVDITPMLKLNFSINTDFSQVEADRRQINLSRFSLFYPEKRQFFLEGNNYYEMNMGPDRFFYSRRIGIDGDREIPLYGGVRLFGKLNRTNLGVMSIQTRAVDSIPTANYSVVQVNQDILQQSNVSGIITQKYDENHYNRTYGAKFIYSTSRVFGNKNFITGGTFALTETRQLGDPDTLNFKNKAYSIFVDYPNDIIDIFVAFKTIEENFNPEMGFLRRSNYQLIFAKATFKPRFKRAPYFRNFEFKPLDIRYYINDRTKKPETFFYEWRPLGFVTHNGDFMEFNVQHYYDHPADSFGLVDDIVIPAGEYFNNRFELQVQSFRGRKFSAGGEVNFGQFYSGYRQRYSINARLNLNKHLNFSFDWQHNELKFSERNTTTDEVGGRIEYAFTPKLATSIFTQWNSQDNYIILNLRVNWIPKIGSFFFFVFNQELFTEGNVRLGRTTILAKLIWRFAL